MYNLTPTETKLTKKAIDKLIKTHKIYDTNEDRLMVKYYNLLKAYKAEQGREVLRNTIKDALQTQHVNGTYSIEEIAYVYETKPNYVKRMIDKATKILKHPRNGKAWRQISLAG